MQVCAMCRRHHQRHLYGSTAEAFCLPKYSQRMQTSFVCRSATILVGATSPGHGSMPHSCTGCMPQWCCRHDASSNTMCVPLQTTSFSRNWRSLATRASFQQNHCRQHSSTGAQLTAALYFSAAPASAP